MIAILEKSEHNVDFHQKVDFVEASHIRYALTINPTVYVSHIRQFWSTARIETTNEGTKILATVDGKPMTISESLIRRNLKLNDEEGISSLPDAKIFENLALMGYNILPNQKFTFQKGTPTEPYHTPSPEAQQSPHHDLSSSLHPTETTKIIPTETPTEIPTLRQYSRRATRIVSHPTKAKPRDNIISGLPPCAGITPSLSTEEPDNSLSMGDEHLDTILATESDEFIKSSVESLVPIPCESEGVPENMCDVPFHDNSPPLDISKDQFEDFFDSNDEFTSTDDDSFSIDNIEYVEASPPNSELVSSEEMEIVIPKVGGIDDDILLTIKDDILREKLLNINRLIANIEALNDNPTPSFIFMTKLVVAVPLLVLIFLFQNMKLSMTIMLKRTTTHYDSSLYDSFIFDLSINPFPPAERSDFYEFIDELTHIISPPEYDCFCFKIEPNSRDFTMNVVEDIFLTREPRVHNALPTHPTFQLNLDFILSSESLFAYVGWIFLFFSHIQLLLNIFYP
uniref:Xylulose kinase-1 n=1 Tax=Tanacetum cinerariifolium TaxID=118510 RepID=A0A6L2KFC7_TANCI|nr:hypothetical protein [Tanacetum cinerariifolium]